MVAFNALFSCLLCNLYIRLATDSIKVSKNKQISGVDRRVCVITVISINKTSLCILLSVMRFITKYLTIYFLF